MTREMIIEQLERHRTEFAHDHGWNASVLESLDVAIKVLKQEPCEDCISREDALKALCKAVHKNDDTIPCPNQRVSCLWNKTKVQDYAEEILKLSPVQPAQKVGKWILSDIQRREDIDNGNYQYFCSNCLRSDIHSKSCKVPYCWYCGAKMQEVEE